MVCRYVGCFQFFLKMCPCWCPPISAGHAAFQFNCFPCGLFTFVFQVRCLHCWHPPFSPFQHCYSLVSLLFPFVSLLVGHCVRLVSLLVSLVVPILVGHCVRLVFLFSFTCASSLPLSLATLHICHPALGCMSLAILYMCLPVSTFVSQLWPPLPCNPLSPSSGRRRLQSQSVPILKNTNCLGSTVV